MITDEGQLHAAHIIERAAQQASNAADRMEAAAHRIGILLEDGYGGNGLRLIEALEKSDKVCAWSKQNPVQQPSDRK